MSEQGTPEWLAERAGHCTASEMSNVLAKLKNGAEAVTRRDYKMRLVTERLINGPVETYKNIAMQWGTDHEAEARMEYEAQTGRLVEVVGFVKHPTIKWFGCSPDGLIGEDGGLQIKCPYKSTVHVLTVESGMPLEHMPQIQTEMLVTGRAWWDFVSFDPRMPEHLRLYVERIERNELFIRDLLTATGMFLAEVEMIYRRLMERAR